MSELSPTARAVAFVAALAVVLAGALGTGRLVGPVEVQASEVEHASNDGAGGPGHGEESHGSGGADGYRLELPATRLAPGVQPLAFSVVGPDGPVTSYRENHERDLHLIVVRRDLTGFQHLHPTLDPATGEWSADVRVEPGSWRLYADFVPEGGEQVVLAADVVVEGAGEVVPLGEDALGTSVDGYDVTLGVDTSVGLGSRAAVTVMRDGEPVTDLEDYLGELGHLVVLRDGDVSYVHGHPVDGSGTGPVIPFDVTFPTGGRYRLFAEFAHGGTVHTAEFTVTVEASDGHAHDHGEEGGDHAH